MTVVTLGIDLGKNLCSLVGMDGAGRVVLRKRLRRARVVSFTGNLPACTMAMEACCGAHHLGRALEALGHTVRLMPLEYVRPYVKAHKNDERDAEAIAPAAWPKKGPPQFGGPSSQGGVKEDWMGIL